MADLAGTDNRNKIKITQKKPPVTREIPKNTDRDPT